MYSSFSWRPDPYIYAYIYVCSGLKASGQASGTPCMQFSHASPDLRQAGGVRQCEPLATSFTCRHALLHVVKNRPARRAGRAGLGARCSFTRKAHFYGRNESPCSTRVQGPRVAPGMRATGSTEAIPRQSVWDIGRLQFVSQGEDGTNGFWCKGAQCVASEASAKSQ